MHTVICAFDDRAEAQRAMERLIERGFRRDMVHLQSGHEGSTAGSSGTPADREQSQGLFESVSRFFSDLFGSDDKRGEAGHYAEAVRRGNAVLVVDAVDEQEAERAQTAMEEMGGTIDMEERASQWRSEGWTGFDPSAGAYPGRSSAPGTERADSLAGAGGTMGAAGRMTSDTMGGAGGTMGSTAGTIASTGSTGDTRAGTGSTGSTGSTGGTGGTGGEGGTVGGSSGTLRDEGDSAARGSASARHVGSEESSSPARSGRESVMPVLQEEIQVGKREVSRGGVRVIQRVTETPVSEMVRLREERAVIERRPVDRPATEADFANFREGTIEVRESSEEAVVSKTVRVVEEVVVGTDVQERTETVSDTVRRTDVEVEHLDPQRGSTGSTRTTGTLVEPLPDDEIASRTK